MKKQIEIRTINRLANQKIDEAVESIERLKGSNSSDNGVGFIHYDFYDGTIEILNDPEHSAPIGPHKNPMKVQIVSPKDKKPIALDFMGTLNDPKAKELLWSSRYDAILNGNTDRLEEAGMSTDQIRLLKDYITRTGCNPMELRDYALQQPGMKKIIGIDGSISAELGQLDFCAIYDDAVNFLTIAKILGHPVEIFSTIKAPKGYRSLQEIMLQRAELPKGHRTLTGCKNALELVDSIVVSDLKKKEPGRAVLEETKSKGIHLYADDELAIIKDVVHVFSDMQGTTLPLLNRIERDGVKNPGYSVPQSHKGITQIVLANTLMDKRLLDTLYKQ